MRYYQGGLVAVNDIDGITTRKPRIVWDAANVKCWSGIGANLVGNITPSWSGWYNTVGKAESYKSPRGPDGVYMRFDYLGYDSNGNSGGAQYYNTGGYVDCSPNTWYTITAYMKYIGQSVPHPNLLYVYQKNSSGATTKELGYYSNTRQLSVGDGWYLVWGKFKTESTTVKLTLQGYNYLPNQIWVEQPQIKLSGIEGINDTNFYWVGQSLTETNASGSVQYNPSAGSISLRSNDSFIAADSAAIASPGVSYTIITATRYRDYGDGSNAYGRIITDTVESTNWLIGHHGGTVLNYHANGWVYNGENEGLDTKWRVYAGVFDFSRNSYKFYVNGEYITSNAGGADVGIVRLGINALSSQGSDCEFGYLAYWDGNLSAAEIKRISYDLMSRYGIS